MNVWNLFFTILIIFTNVIKSEVITFFNLSPVHRVDNTTMNKDKFISNDIEIPSFKNLTLREGKKYIFSKIYSQNCNETPFYFDKDTNLEFYADDCHTSTYQCSDGKKKSGSNSDSFSLLFTAVISISAIAPTSWPTLIATTKDPSRDKCYERKTECTPGHYGSCHTKTESNLKVLHLRKYNKISLRNTLLFDKYASTLNEFVSLAIPIHPLFFLILLKLLDLILFGQLKFVCPWVFANETKQTLFSFGNSSWLSLELFKLNSNVDCTDIKGKTVCIEETASANITVNEKENLNLSIIASNKTPSSEFLKYT
ncbi:hypothetical protein U3516DRAFT_772443 [Neocallimastix sp. 'constans']